MDVKPGDKTFRRSGFWVLVVVLLILMAGQVVQIAAAMHLVDAVSRPRRTQAGRIAWLSLLLLCIEAMLLFWVVIRHAREGLSRTAPRQRTQYVDIWAEAGQRFQLQEDEEDEEDEQSDPPDR
ncbi:MAG: hypothetical protein ACLFUJ_06330 [Phycisphaerae bacterium]